MTKKLAAKTQELNPKLPQFSSSFSKCISIPPETTEVLLKKGTIFAIFEITGYSNFDTELVVKVINDVLHDSYYQSENISPVQSMEKAISETKEKILQLSNDTLTSDPHNINLNFISAVLWGNVLYVIKFGEAAGFALKSGEMSPLEMMSEGNFSSFSKLVGEDEVFIFCTKSFAEAFPTDRLLNSSIPENDLGENQACLLMRLLIDKTSQDEEIDLGLGNAVAKSQTRERVDKVSKVLKIIKINGALFLGRIIKALKPAWEYIKEVVGKVIPKRKAVLFTRKITQVGGAKSKKFKGWVFLSLVAILLAVSVFYTFKSKIFKETPKDEVAETEVKEDEQKEVVAQEDRSKDQEYKIARVSPEVFYDLKIADTSADPSEIQIVGEKVAVVDRSTGKIFHSEISTPNFVQEQNTYQGIKSLAQTGNLLSFNDNEGYKTYDIKNSKLVDSYKVESLNTTYPYADFIYSISDDILTRSVEKDGALEGTLWGQNAEFKNARSMAIAYSVYVLKENGELVNFSGGAKTGFTVSGLEKSFLEPVKVVADLDFTYIYVADRGNKRIVVLNKDGELVRQYKNNEDVLWGDIRGVAVSSDESLIFVLDGSKVYKLKIEE